MIAPPTPAGYRPRHLDHVVVTTLPADGPDAPWGSPPMVGVVVAHHIDGEHAWVLDDDDARRLVPIADLAPWAGHRPAA